MREMVHFSHFYYLMPPGFDGDRCEINIDDCAAEPCAFGTCIDGVAGYTCECEVPYEGNNCDVYVGEFFLLSI